MEGDPRSHVLSLCSSNGEFHQNINDMLPNRGIEGGSGGVIKVGMLEGVLAGGVEASGGGGSAQRRVRGHKATGGCGHDGGWELGVGAKPRVGSKIFY